MLTKPNTLTALTCTLIAAAFAVGLIVRPASAAAAQDVGKPVHEKTASYDCQTWLEADRTPSPTVDYKMRAALRCEYIAPFSAIRGILDIASAGDKHTTWVTADTPGTHYTGWYDHPDQVRGTRVEETARGDLAYPGRSMYVVVKNSTHRALRVLPQTLFGTRAVGGWPSSLYPGETMLLTVYRADDAPQVLLRLVDASGGDGVDADIYGQAKYGTVKFVASWRGVNHATGKVGDGSVGIKVSDMSLKAKFVHQILEASLTVGDCAGTCTVGHGETSIGV
jgi:hypothetical protein